MRRVSFTMDGELYKAMEEAMARLGESSRSRFIASAISSYLSEVAPPGASVFALIVVVFDHKVGDVDKELTNIQHDYRDVIRATTHLHLTEELCAEVVHIVGPSDKLKEIVNRLSRVGRGVKYIRIVSTPIAE